MNVYLKSFQLIAPFDNDVVQTLNAHWDYWGKYGYTFVDHFEQPANELLDSLGTYSHNFGKRISSAKLSGHTLSDFHESTRPGDPHAVFVFSVISTEKDIVDETIEKILPNFLGYIQRKRREHEDWQITEVKETIFPLNGIGFENLNREAQKIESWEKLIWRFPYVDKVYKWLLINRNYPQVK